MYHAIYLEISLISCIVPLLILFRCRQSNDRQESMLAYCRVVKATIVVLLLDAAWSMLENRTGTLFRILNYLVNIGYMAQMGYIGYLWLLFVLSRLSRRLSRFRYLKWILALPCAGLLVMSLLTPWTGWLFSITPDNVYHRGSLNLVHVLISYGYIIASTAYALAIARRASDRERRSNAYTLASFVILPAIGGVINFFVYGLPVLWALTSTSLLMVYMNLQARQISTDELTGLNNRRQFDRYLQIQIDDQRREDRLYLLLLDIDDFKTINDTYGHPVGDDALVCASGILKQVCSVWDCFLARYGGDEFAIVFRSREPVQLERLKADLTAAFERFSESNKTPYKLSISIGASAFARGGATAANLIAAADQALYEAKAARKSGSNRARTISKK